MTPKKNCVYESLSNDGLQDNNCALTQELRTSLTPIQGVLGLLQSGKLNSLSEEGQKLLAIALNNTNRLVRVISAMETKQVQPMTIFSHATLEKLKLETDLCSALERRELEVFYQPIVSLETDKITGFEALLRWRHPHRGFVPPSEFIPLAEEIGLIHSLGRWVITQACRQLKTWQQQFPSFPPITMSINLSPLQLLEYDFVAQVKQILEETGVAPKTIKLEITETALVENYQKTNAILHQLKNLGLQLYIDDFGTGYSSLSRLQTLPIDALKIDRSFVTGKQWDIIESIILLASKLGLQTILEGIETLEEVIALKNIGCKYVQGYFFSKPVDSQQALRLLANELATAACCG